MPKNHSELSRVQMPAVYHLERLGYTYIHSPKEFDPNTNILTDVFAEALHRLNPDFSDLQVKQEIDEIRRILDNDDLGREFYHKLTAQTGTRYIDFNNPKNNTWYCTTEFTCENQETHDNFRPDITCFINGLPIAFIEVKIPNNHDGILAERDRANRRMANRAFRRFFNITQLMIYSNNQEYDNQNRVPVQGAFYASTSRSKAFFNVFREQSQTYYERIHLNQVSDEEEYRILKSLNLVVIKAMSEYQTNLRPTTPTNRILSSLLAKERILFLLRYGFCYVERSIKNDKGELTTTLEKHVMRYQQFFATLAIRRTLDKGIKSGIIWHTQGSGKTALAYYSNRSLTDYFSAKDTATKFYFIVDRLNLMQQAAAEFTARGLHVRTANSREELMADFRKNSVIENAEGKPEYMVVNIQKFEEDHTKVELPDTYGIKLQRVFFIDEAHRGYNPKGSFLANLMDADKDAIKIALTGTPLLSEERASWKVFGDYIDKYYYDKSIADGYTLRLMREDIETTYKEKLISLLDEAQKSNVQVKKSDIDQKAIIESDNYIEALIDYVDHDLRIFRIEQAHPEVAGMIVCETNEQARKLYNAFKTIQAKKDKPLHAEIILHDEYDKLEREQIVDNFKTTEDLDLLIVNQMLLTGFDAPRLKRLYLTRKLKDHDLLQALTRVNRPYKDFKNGYVVDFAGIKENFEETNNRYLRELNRCDGTDDPNEEPQNDGNPTLADAILEDKDAVINKLKDFKATLFAYSCSDTEAFREELDEITDRQVLYDLRHTLEDAKALSNQIRTFGDEELREAAKKLRPGDISNLLSEVNHRIDRVNQQEDLNHTEDVQGAVNIILSQIEYEFKKKGIPEELQIINNDIKERYIDVTREFEANFDQVEPRFVNLLDQFREYFRKRGFVPEDVADAKARIQYMDEVMKTIRAINRENNRIKRAYKNDERFVRIHKRIVEENETRKSTGKKPVISSQEYEVAEGLNLIKDWIDDLVYKNLNYLENEPAFNREVLMKVSDQLFDMHIESDVSDRKFISGYIAKEYLQQYHSLQTYRAYA